MNKKLFAQLFLAMLVSNYAVADSEGFFKKIGRSYGNSTSVKSKPVEKISWKDANDLKKQMRKISKDLSHVSTQKKEEINAKVTMLADLVKKNQIAKNKVKRSKKQ